MFRYCAGSLWRNFLESAPASAGTCTIDSADGSAKASASRVSSAWLKGSAWEYGYDRQYHRARLLAAASALRSGCEDQTIGRSGGSSTEISGRPGGDHRKLF